MNNLLKTIILLISVILMSCGGNGDKNPEKEQVKIGTPKKESVKETPKDNAESALAIDLNNKGVGPIKNLDLPTEIDNAMAATGAEVFKLKCTACHKPTKRFIGPAPAGIMERRSPEWIMNMILDPEGMVKNDPIAKQLLIDYNGSPMANQSLTEEEARSILEYFRTLKM
ncbi:c-type cytochrome [Aureisphaera sp.]